MKRKVIISNEDGFEEGLILKVKSSNINNKLKRELVDTITVHGDAYYWDNGENEAIVSFDKYGEPRCITVKRYSLSELERVLLYMLA